MFNALRTVPERVVWNHWPFCHHFPSFYPSIFTPGLRELVMRERGNRLLFRVFLPVGEAAENKQVNKGKMQFHLKNSCSLVHGNSLALIS